MPLKIRNLAAWLAARELFLLALVAPWMLFPGAAGLGGHLTPWLGLAIAGLGWIARWITFGRPALPTPLDLPLALLVGLAWLGYAISITPELSWNRLWSLVFSLLLYYSLVNWARTERRLRQAVWFLGLLTLGMAALSLVGTDWSKVRMLDLPWLYEHLPSLATGLPGSGVSAGGELFNPRWVGITLGFLAPLFLALLLYGGDGQAVPKGAPLLRGGRGGPKMPQVMQQAAFAHEEPGWLSDRALRWMAGIVLLACLALLLLTQAIQGLVAFAAGSLFLLVWRTPASWRWAWVVLPLNALVLAMYFWVERLRPLAIYLLSPDNPVGIAVSLRLDIWSRALAMLHDLPYSGVGLNAFQAVQARFYPGFALGLEPHAHNLYLQTALDLGLPGLFIFGWLVVAWFLAAHQRYQRADGWSRLLLAGTSACLVGYLAHGFLDALMLGAKPTFALWWVLALGMAAPPGILSARRPKPASAQAGFKRGLLASLPLLVLLAGILTWMQWQPASLSMNLGALQGQHALARIDAGQAPDALALGRARLELEKTVALDPQRVFAYELLGNLDAWLGDPGAALQAYQARVALDVGQPEPLRTYALPAYWLRYLQVVTWPPPSPLADLQEVYRNWQVRYPGQAGHSLRLALLLKDHLGQAPEAEQVLRDGLQRGAQPAILLEDALERGR